MDFKSLWNSTAAEEKKTFGGDTLPEGTYITEVISCKLGPTKAGDKDMVSWNLKVIEGAQKNCHIFVNRSFSKTDQSDQNIKAIKAALEDFKQLGLPCTAEVIGKTMREVVGKNIEIKLVASNNGGQFQNFKRIVEKPVAAAASFGSEVFPESDIPF